MVSGGGGSRGAGKKRKGAHGGGGGGGVSPAKREPRRGLGVAELERIRAELEVVERCYLVPRVPALAPPPLPLPPAPPPLPLLLPPPPPPPSVMIGHVPGVSTARHQYVGKGAVQMEYFTPYYSNQHYPDDSLPRFFTSNGHPYAYQKNQVDLSAVTAIPVLGQATSSESSSSAYQLQDRRQAQPQQLGQMRKPKVSFVDLVDSDDEDGGAVQELDLELKL
ncbi:hypothetical protein ACP70R_048919 [Stipagrostis hirtigluma subsp. patula]